MYVPNKDGSFVLTRIFLQHFILIFVYGSTEITTQLKPVEVVRTVISTGFHRILQYNVSIPGVSGKTHILIEEDFPQDIYLDSYQILQKINDNKIKIIGNTPINTEAPAYKAEPFKVQLCSISNSNVHSIELPIHFRYQKPHQCSVHGDFIVATLESPSLYFKSNIKDNNTVLENSLTCISNQNGKVPWTKLQTVSFQTHFEVPVGCTEHLLLVLVLTIGIIGSSTVYLCKVLISFDKKEINT